MLLGLELLPGEAAALTATLVHTVSDIAPA